MIHSQPLSLLRGVYLVLWRSSGVDCTASLGGTRGPVFSVSWSHSPDSEWAGQREVGEEEGRVSVSAALVWTRSSLSQPWRHSRGEQAHSSRGHAIHRYYGTHHLVKDPVLAGGGCVCVCVCVCAQCLFVLLLWNRVFQSHYSKLPTFFFLQIKPDDFVGSFLKVMWHDFWNAFNFNYLMHFWVKLDIQCEIMHQILNESRWRNRLTHTVFVTSEKSCR